jgi:hypothetical protein
MHGALPALAGPDDRPPGRTGSDGMGTMGIMGTLGTTGRRSIWVVSAVAAVALGAAGGAYFGRRTEPPPSMLALEKMGRLVSVKVNVADVVEFTQDRTFGIPWSSWQVSYAGTKVLLIAKGDCLVATDLQSGRYEAVDAARRSATLVMAAPAVLQARVNHAPPEQGGSRLYAISNQGIEAIIPGNDSRGRAIEGAMRLAQARIEEAGRSPDVQRAARENAELVLKSAFGALGWTVTVRWQ